MKELGELKQTLILGDQETFFKLLDVFYKRIKEENSLDGEEFLSEIEAMKMLKITSKSTMFSYRANGLPFHQIGRKVLIYKRSDLEAFINRHRVEGF